VFVFGVVKSIFGLEIEDIGHCFVVKNIYNEICSQMKANFNLKSRVSQS